MAGVLEAPERDGATEPTPEDDWAHRPALDGLRAVAVYAVVAFHGGLALATGGFIGVDLFFVLSGFLVTSILVREHRREGRIRFARFYARRVRRLLAAAAVTILGTAAAFVLVAPPADRLAVLGGAKSAFLYVANWYFLHQANDYFAAEADPSPFLHFWSLAIEEQFYLVFPLVLTAVFAVARWARRQAVVVVGLASLCALSLLSQVVSARTSELRAYYATDARLYQILAGATLAAVVWRRPVRARLRGMGSLVWLALAAFLLVASSAWSLTSSMRGIVATAIAVVLILALEGARESTAARALSRPAITYLGRISYGTYLWHWPVIVLTARVIELSPIATTAVAAVVGTALAALSYQLLETPIRRSRVLSAFNGPVIACGLALSLVGAFVLAPAILHSDRPMAVAVDSAPVVAAGVTDGPVPADVPWKAAQTDTPVEPVCLDRPATDCIVVPGDGLRIHLVGDSHAKTLLPLFTQLAQDRGYQFSATVTGACPWQNGLMYVDNEERSGRCEAMQPDWYDRVIPDLDPDIVVVFSRAWDDPAFPRKMTSTDGELSGLDQNDLVRTTTERTIDQLVQDGRKVVILEPIPIAPKVDPTACLSSAAMLSTCAFQANAAPLKTEDIERYADLRSPSVWSLDIDRMACPDLPTCMPMVGDMVVRRDRHHLTGTYARSLSDQMGALLDRAGVLEGPSG